MTTKRKTEELPKKIFVYINPDSSDNYCYAIALSIDNIPDSYDGLAVYVYILEDEGTFVIDRRIDFPKTKRTK